LRSEPSFSSPQSKGNGTEEKKQQEIDFGGSRGPDSQELAGGMAAERQLVVAVEGTAALGPYWSTIVSDYVEKIVRYGRAPASPLLPMMLFSWHSCHQALARVDRGRGSGSVP
jgi:hypothetical protein